MNQLFSKPDLYLGRCGQLRFRVSEQAIPGAPSFLRGLRALFVTDVHVLPETRPEALRALADALRRLSPDLLLLGGDYADRADQARRLFAALTPLAAPLGCFGVLGNNDRETWPTPDPLRAAMAEAGCRLLINESARLDVNGGALWIGGVDEHLFGHPDAAGLFPESAAPDAYRILLSHYPRAVSPAPELTLCGHTHGGQFNLLGVTPYTVGFERLTHRERAPQVIAGLHRAGGALLLVSKGIGASRLQWRVGVRPEINLLRFV